MFNIIQRATGTAVAFLLFILPMQVQAQVVKSKAERLAVVSGRLFGTYMCSALIIDGWRTKSAVIANAYLRYQNEAESTAPGLLKYIHSLPQTNGISKLHYQGVNVELTQYCPEYYELPD
jgi:non-ribosomal peptide synthetase component E (peptide arylation enzyme)